MMVLVIMTLCAALVFVLGLLMKKGHGLMLLSGYNRMPKEVRDSIDKEELSRATGNLMLRLALMLVLLGILIYFGLTLATKVLVVAIMADSFVFAVRMYGKTPARTVTKRGLIISLLSGIIAIIAVGFIFYYGEKEPVVSVSNNNIHIESMYGLEINFSEISGISLVEKSMDDIGAGHRNNGYGGLGDTLKGHFDSKSLGDILLFVNSGSSPTIWIERNSGEDVYISFSDGEKTKMLYQELTAASVR